MNGKSEESWFERVGGRLSGWVADLAAHPYAQIGVIVVCAIWFAASFATDLLTAILSIMAITLTQMVLNNQAQREIDIHRRDVAMHAKLDELIAASRRAKNDFVGIEDREEEEIVQLKEEVKEAIEHEPEAAADPEVRDTAKRMVEQATEDVERGRDSSEAREDAAAARSKRKAAKR
jgi:low affinity Fe/Cu permease